MSSNRSISLRRIALGLDKVCLDGLAASLGLQYLS